MLVATDGSNTRKSKVPASPKSQFICAPGLNTAKLALFLQSHFRLHNRLMEAGGRVRDEQQSEESLAAKPLHRT
jgi:hypothetical protein